jgi:type II secretory ATPase GspE/PulE/Tfp pilus assembly ATPase PilB-like protein
VTGDRPLKQAIHDGAGYPELLAVARAQGFKSMQEDGKQKVLAGLTTPEEVMKAVSTQAVE